MTETKTVTVLFTDVVGSTSLRQHQGDAAAQESMNAHNEIVRRQIGEHAGQEVKTPATASWWHSTRRARPSSAPSASSARSTITTAGIRSAR
jgi:class 3 adenylate cyclase